MSLSAVSHVVVPPVTATPAVHEVTRVRDGAAGQGQQPPQASGRAHPYELVDALVDAVAPAGAALEPKAQQAVQRFAYALMQDLRTVAGSGEAPAVRPDWNDVGSQLGTLASAAAPQPSADGQAMRGATLGDEVPPLPSPLTATTAAVHLMQVPSSRLVEAFIALRGAVGSIAEVSGGSGDDRAQLAAFLQKLAEAAPQAASPAGALLHARA